MSILIVAIGGILLGAGVVILFDLGGAAGALTRRVTSRNLGSLAPGYAADRIGLRVYAVLVSALGLAVAGIGISPSSPLVGVVALAIGAIVFAIASVLIIAGEVRVYRSLPPRSGG